MLLGNNDNQMLDCSWRQRVDLCMKELPSGLQAARRSRAYRGAIADKRKYKNGECIFHIIAERQAQLPRARVELLGERGRDGKAVVKK